MINLAFGLLVYTMFYTPYTAPVFTAPHNEVASQEAITAYMPGVDPHGTDELQPNTKLIGPVNGQMPTPYYQKQEVPQSEYPAVPYGVPMITVCYKNEAGQWLIEQRTLYSGNADTIFTETPDQYIYRGTCGENSH